MIFNKTNFKFSRFNNFGLLVFVCLLITGCGGAGTGGGSKGGPASSYTIGGSISGLAGPVVLQDMGGDNLTISADGKFTFAVPINNGNLYNVTVLTQPTGQTCSISSGSGIVSGNTVANVAIFCSSNTYTIGGTVSGLTGSVTLQINGNSGETITLSGNGAYNFNNPIAYGSPYAVTVLTQPSTVLSCSVSGGNGSTAGTGTINTGANVTNLNINCATSSFSIGGNVYYLTTAGNLLQNLELKNNGGDPLTILSSGTFHFQTGVPYNLPYNVTVSKQPTGQACVVSTDTGSATHTTANVNNVSVTCGNLKGGNLQGHALSLTPTISTLVGTQAGVNGTGPAARFANPGSVVSDGTYLYVADTGNNKIRKIEIATKIVTTFAGSVTNSAGAADGKGTAASFNGPRGITTDGIYLYVTDTNNFKIRKINIATKDVTSLTGPQNAPAAYSSTCIYDCDGAGSAASFSYPAGIVYLAGYLYVADMDNCKIRKLDTNGYTVSSLTGTANTNPYSTGGINCGAVDNTGNLASFYYPQGITTDGTNLYVTDSLNNKIRMIAPNGSNTLASATSTTVTVSSFTGSSGAYVYTGSADGAGSTATFYSPQGITTDGISLYVADYYNNKIRKIDIATKLVSSLTGIMNIPGTLGTANGVGPAARFNHPNGIFSDGINLYVSESGSNTIRIVSLSPVNVGPLAGDPAGTDGIGAAASMNYPRGITTDGVNLYVADTSGNTIRQINLATGSVTTLAGSGSAGAIDDVGANATFNGPIGVTTDGISVFVADTGNNKIRQIDIASGTVTSLTGSPNTAGPVGYSICYSSTLSFIPYFHYIYTVLPACSIDSTDPTLATFNNPTGITTDGTYLYITDSTNNKIRKVQISNGAVSSLTGSANTPGPSTAVDGSATSATFNYPTGIATDGTNLYVADSYNNKIRVFNLSTNVVSSLWSGLNNTYVPQGAADTTNLYQTLYPTFNSPQSLTTDGTFLYIADTYNSKIRSINISTLAVASVTGIPDTSGTFGASDGGAGTTANPLATFSYPMGITTDGVSLYVTDNANFTVRKIQ